MSEIMTLKQLPVIEEHLQVIKEEVLKKTDEAKSLVCTEDTVKLIKEVRASLNSEFKGWESKRIQMKDAIMQPYAEFEKIYKECISDIYKKCDAELKEKISFIEDEIKSKKEAEVSEFFDEYAKSKEVDFVTAKDANMSVTLSVSLKKLKDQAREFIDRICDDLSLISSHDNKDEILYYYKGRNSGMFLNASKAITTVLEKEKAVKKIESITVPDEKKKEIEDKPLSSPSVVQECKKVTVSFKVTDTIEKLKILKQFLIENKYDFE